MPDRRTTIKDVAAHAGVSLATASRALSGNRPMSEELRARVLASAQELNYRVNLLGRALRQQRHPVVGLSVPDLENPFFAALAEHLSRTLRGAGFELLVSSAGGSVEAEAEGVQAFLGRQVHAVVIIACDESASARTVQDASSATLTVQLDRRVDGVDAAYVGCDNRHGMDLVADHLRRQAVADSKVVFVGAGAESSSARERLQGFLAHFPGSRTMLGSFSLDWGIRAAEQLVEEGRVAGSTLVAAADIIALGLISGLRGQGYEVPGDVRVVGFDGIGPAAFAHPPLTTVRQPVEQMCTEILQLVSTGGDASGSTDGPGSSRLFWPTLVGGPSATGGPRPTEARPAPG
ncbi:LacI family DNA-binding transcriptional regulator [Ornithinimicrobium humiphilum]|uniref:LacI family transcriptional regulator n=1 Tax=Ornithinimicrobium humiphilum TaxID=125288 RepID=A0A543KRF3_9MICO|nr:LacI family DNA-binding transcriptional regulator [Ornithinimicrobium humiphilum]TQM97658.1 LacI family transcriptional regulator [Ornithinimicrobium humiphilum]